MTSGARVAQAQSPESAGTAVLEILDASNGKTIRGAVVYVSRVDGTTGDAVEVAADRLGETRWSFVARSGVLYLVRVVALGYEDAAVPVAGHLEQPTVLIRLRPAPLQLPEVRASARRDRRTVTVHRIDRERQNLRGRDLGDWLRDLPGFDVIGRSPGGRTVASVRGSRPSAVEVTLDGIPLTDPLTGVADLSLVPAGTLETVVAEAGPGGGAGWAGSSGTIRLTTRMAEPGVRGSVGVGSFGRVSTEAVIGVQSGTVRFGGQLRYESARNDFSFLNRVRPGTPAEDRVNADYENWGGSGRLSFDGVPVTLIARLDAVERGAPGRMGSQLWDLARWGERAVTVGASLREDDSGAGRRISLSWSGRDQKYSDKRVDRVDRLRADQVVASGAEGLPAGIDLTWRATWARIGGEALAEPTTRIIGGVRATRAVELSGGWGLDVSMAVDAADLGAAVSPGAGVSWARAGKRVWLRAGQGYRLPTFGDLFLRPGMGAVPNPDLEPERVVLDAELGAEHTDETGTLRIAATTFVRQTRNPIIWLPSVTSVWRPVNAGRLAAYGVETLVSWSPRPGWTARASGTVQDSRIRFDEYSSRMPYHPRVSGNISLERRGSGPDGRVDLELRGARRTSVYGPHELPAFALLSVRARQPFHAAGFDGVLEVGVSNVLDVAYERVELFPEPGRTLELRLELIPRRQRSLQANGADRNFVPAGLAAPVVAGSATTGPTPIR
ncbi:MAG: TonB-dependent receptor [Gemmatimonadota bacterium]